MGSNNKTDTCRSNDVSFLSSPQIHRVIKWCEMVPEHFINQVIVNNKLIYQCYIPIGTSQSFGWSGTRHLCSNKVGNPPDQLPIRSS